MTRSKNKTSVGAVAVLLRCNKVGCADLSQRHSDSLLPCHFSPAPSPSDPTETLHGRPSREGGKNKQLSDALSENGDIDKTRKYLVFGTSVMWLRTDTQPTVLFHAMIDQIGHVTNCSLHGLPCC